ncbi:MAG: flagellar M-ring protein FliF [Deltaproteobacteria bacterium]|jgi:flagellar M-ring protein FliF|nr:flagellar M-ring protein FliF [Deltaproteobacteria bacterium]
MPNALNEVVDKVKGFWHGINFTQRMLVGVIAMLVISAFFILIFMMNQTPYQPLYTNLAPEDASRVIKSLDAQKIKYKLADNGSAILVTEDQVHQLRIRIAGEGNVLGQGIGFEIFDEIKVGQTDFVQKTNYQRALQGELARTISELPMVESARVHLSIPQRSLFIEDQQKPSAGVMLKLKDGRRMDSKDVLAIVNLVTMAVEGLSKERVSVTDSTGKTLFQPEEEGSLFGMTSAQFEQRMLTQQNLERRIEDLLSPVVGPGRIIAKVNVVMDFSQKTIRKELYDPDVSVVRSETRMEEQTQGRANLESGVPDVNFRGDGLADSTSTQSSNREERATNYEINKEEQNIIGSVGDINRLSVAVIVDGTYVPNETGELTFVPRSAEEIKNIRQLVANVVGFDSARGDTIEVSNIPFGPQVTDESQNVAQLLADYALRLGKPFLNAFLILLFLLIVVRPVVMALIRPKVEGEMLEELSGLPSGEERLALMESDDEEMDAMAILEKIEDIKAHALHLSEQNMEQALGIIRNWMKKVDANAKNQTPAKAA